jgi:large exoprotein involved in heme utilization and adhesion
VTTEAAQASGGSIKLTAQDLIQLNDSLISSSVQGNAMTVGGDINLDPDFIILQNSQVLAKAVQGQGGNISLIANKAVLVDPFSTLDASSALGVSGSVNIQAPTKFLSGAILPLEQKPVNVAALYGSRCAASSGGQFSSFVDSKADSLSPTPGAFLASPLLHPAASNAVAERSSGQRAPVILTASIAPLVLGHAGPTTACP